jgi:hypothetical protein
MKICHTYRVEFETGVEEWEVIPQHVYHLQDDDGVRSEVTIVDLPKVRQVFEWMSDNDCLRHLCDIKPTIQDNQDEIIERLSSNTRMYHQKNISYSTMTRMAGQGLQRVIKFSWTFWSKEHAVMTKLALGGII